MTRRQQSIVSVAVSVTMLILLVPLCWLGGFRINLTPSYPIGLWRIEPLEREVWVGDLVFICPPPTPAFGLARERGYVRFGLCPGWMSPLIKTVVALPGQQVDVGDGVTIDGVPLAHSGLRQADAEGRPLVQHQGGIVPAGCLFLHSEYEGSYDSRYFGALPAEGLLGLARPVSTLAP